MYNAQPAEKLKDSTKIELLKMALRPFANYIQDTSFFKGTSIEDASDEFPVLQSNVVQTKVTIGDFRNAYELLKRLQ